MATGQVLEVTAIYDDRDPHNKGWFARSYDPAANETTEEQLPVRRRDGYGKAAVLAAEWAGLDDASAVTCSAIDGSPIP